MGIFPTLRVTRIFGVLSASPGAPEGRCYYRGVHDRVEDDASTVYRLLFTVWARDTGKGAALCTYLLAWLPGFGDCTCGPIEDRRQVSTLRDPEKGKNK